MTKLEELIIKRIQETGPISISTFMRECLLHPEHGFYTQRNALGSNGDFITSPEISQMFGEILGLCLAQYWIDLNRPARFALVELGPGNGTLMLDILRAGSSVNGFIDACKIYLVEASSKLKRQQQKKLSQFNVNWITDDLLLPKVPTFFIANEFFDALPVKQYQRKNDLWYEIQVGLKNVKLSLGMSQVPSNHPELETRFKERFGIDVLLWHSKISKKNRQKIWHQCFNGDEVIVIGARSSLFLPFSGIDPEIKSSYHFSSITFASSRFVVPEEMTFCLPL